MKIFISIIIAVAAFFATAILLANSTRMREQDLLFLAVVAGIGAFVFSLMKLPTISIKRVFMTNVSEGRRRLRLLISIVATLVTYPFLISDYGPRFSSWDWVSDEEALIGFPLLTGLCFGLSYCLVTAIYWVRDGFDKEELKEYNQEKFIKEELNKKSITAKELFEIADGASLEFHGKLVSIAGIQKCGDDKLDRINSIMTTSWQHPALAYSFGLTCICMIKNQRNFLQSQLAKEFFSIVADRFEILSKETSAKFNPAYANADPVKSKVHAENQVREIIQGVMSFSKAIGKGRKDDDPLQFLNGYVSNITGLKEREHFEKMSSAGRTLLLKIDKLLT